MMVFSPATLAGMMAFIHDKRTTLTVFGENSLMVYLLHPYAVRIIQYCYNKITTDVWTMFLLDFLFAIGITWLFSRTLVRNVYDKIKGIVLSLADHLMGLISIEI